MKREDFEKELAGHGANYYSLLELKEKGIGHVEKLPICIRIVLEALLRNLDGNQVSEEDVVNLASWNAKKPKAVEIPFKVARVVAQDFTGVPLLVDLAAMRSIVKKLGGDPSIIEPLCPVDLVVDHSVQVDKYGSDTALQQNVEIEFTRNKERYEFLKWGRQAFKKFNVVPPSVGIIHQVNLEYLASVVINDNGVAYPDTLVGTDSHTTMINGIGIVGWGVGGIEAEAAMLGQPVYFLTPEVIGVNLEGTLKQGVTATDLVLRIVEMLREEKVVGKFIEFFGAGVEQLSLPDRATISNMCPEYGATIGFFPTDEETLSYMKATGRSEGQIKLTKDYLEAQGLFGIPKKGELDYTKVLELDLGLVEPCLAGPKRPQDRINLSEIKGSFDKLLTTSVSEGGFGMDSVTKPAQGEVGNGSVVIAAITSCTNTSNPSVMLGAGLLAKNAVEKGLKVPSYVKTSLGPGSRVVTEYLEETGLLSPLEEIGFNVVGYGCTTCIGNSGPLPEEVQPIIAENKDLVLASVLSGNRNFEARVHGDVRSSFLMSPTLVVAFALAGKVDIDFETEPVGEGNDGAVFLKDIWPSNDDIASVIKSSLDPEKYTNSYDQLDKYVPEWSDLSAPTGQLYDWNEKSTYIQEPPFFEDFELTPKTITDIQGAKILALLGDSITTDHISPAGAIKNDTPAGKYLVDNHVDVKDFNTYGSRRGNDRVMTRGTFANVRVKNQILDNIEGGFTKLNGKQVSIFDAAVEYKNNATPLVIFAGKEYGTGSSRDWAAKGTKLLGVRAVIAESFERIHRSNLIGMGVLPLQFQEGENWKSLGLTGDEEVALYGIEDGLAPLKELKLEITDSSGTKKEATVIARIDTAIEVEYYKQGGILDYVIRNLMGN